MVVSTLEEVKLLGVAVVGTLDQANQGSKQVWLLLERELWEKEWLVLNNEGLCFQGNSWAEPEWLVWGNESQCYQGNNELGQAL